MILADQFSVFRRSDCSSSCQPLHLFTSPTTHEII